MSFFQQTFASALRRSFRLRHRFHLLTFFVLMALVQTRVAQTTFHGNVARTGVYESPELRNLKGPKWTFKTGGAIFSSPAIAAGIVYVGSSDGFLYAVDQQTGQ